MSSGDVRFQRKGVLGIVILDRPAALNALTHEMVNAMSRQLAAWRNDSTVAAVLVKAAAGRAFCAGGDIRAVTQLARSEGVAKAAEFFAHEYRLNWRIHSYPKPYVAFIDGVTMGGGVGISVHGPYRIATEQTLFAMPETTIGFFPDVGGTWFLPRLPGELGMYLGLTGHRLHAADCRAAGIATHNVVRERLPEIEDRLAAGRDIDSCLAALSSTPSHATLDKHRAQIDRCFAGVTLDAVMEALKAEPTGWGEAQLNELAGKCPVSLRVTFAQLRRGRALARFEDTMRLEYRMVHRFLERPDFFEGVRALLVDKDKRPHWSRLDPQAVEESLVEACFAPLPGGDLAFDWEGI
jgi:enoyl-CoA hydratase/carnithine racemase